MLLGLVKGLRNSWQLEQEKENWKYAFVLCWKFQTVLGKKGMNFLSLFFCGGGVLKPLG